MERYRRALRRGRSTPAGFRPALVERSRTVSARCGSDQLVAEYSSCAREIQVVDEGDWCDSTSVLVVVGRGKVRIRLFSRVKGGPSCCEDFYHRPRAYN